MNKIREIFHRWKARRLYLDASAAQRDLDEATKTEQLRIQMLHDRAYWHERLAETLEDNAQESAADY